MGFQLVPKSGTLNDLVRRNGRVVCIISPNLVEIFRRKFPERLCNLF